MKLIKNATKDKLRGGFYTPETIVKFILKWGFNGSKNFDVLEPSCGDGAFLKEIKQNGYKYNSITAVELNKSEMEKSKKIGLNKNFVLNCDFHTFCNQTNKKFDLVVGNPPYIRYQYFDKKQQKEAGIIFDKANLKYSKLTNAWVSFVVGSSLLLKNKGKIGFVLPAEILQVSYAERLRGFLTHYYCKINIVSFEKLVFPKIQQEVVLLLCEKNGSSTHCIEHLELKDASDLENLNVAKLKTPKKRIDFRNNKWSFYFLNQKEISFLEAFQHNNVLPRFGEFAEVEVGITTGSNPYFTIPLSTVEKYNLNKYVKPLVGRSVQVPNIIFSTKDWEKNRDKESRTHLVVFPNKRKIKDNKRAVSYIKEGEKLGINKGYKCSIRNEWYIVPSLRISDALFIRRNNLYPRLIINKAKAYTTDTMHRVNMKFGTDIKAFTASYYNSISLAFAEICGRSHGGGVLELMPNEVENIFVPYCKNNSDLLSIINDMLSKGCDITKILEITNKKVLKKNYGFSDKDILMANNIWEKLSSRRLNRGKR